ASLLAAALSACGGGGVQPVSGSPNNPNQQPPAPPAPPAPPSPPSPPAPPSPPPPGNPPAGALSFADRCAKPEVGRCVGFDSAADIPSGLNSANFGIFAAAGDPTEKPTLDTSVKASGASSLRFRIPPNSGADTSGAYFTNFSSDLSRQFG